MSRPASTPMTLGKASVPRMRPCQPSARRTAIAATIGNVLEWYDFLVYGFLSLTIARLFFPSDSELASLLLASATFGVGLIVRPIGAVVLGLYADRAGRKAALSATILLMALGTCLLAFAPTFEFAGIWAPVIVVTARMLQGFSCGGELGGATAILAESAPAAKRGLYASWQTASQFCAFLLGSLVNLAVSSSLSRAQLEAGGWRLPLVIGLLIVPVGLHIRATLEESPLFRLTKLDRDAHSRATMPPRAQLRSAAVAAGIAVLYVAAPYVLLLYMPTFAVRQLHLPLPHALIASVITAVLGLALCPLVGALSDRVGRRPLMLFAAVALAGFAYPAFVLVTSVPHLGTLVAVQSIFGLLTVLYSAPANAVFAECFPTRTRSVSMATAYNLVAAVVGGFAQFIVIWLTAATGNPRAPAFYVVAAASISAGAVWMLHDRYRDPLQ